MNENHKRTRSFAVKSCFAVALGVTFLMNSNSAMASDLVSNRSVTSIEQQNRFTASGIVVDATGAPVIGASISEKGTRNGCITDVNGRFSLKVKSGSILSISYIGYKSQEVRAGRDLKITLSESANALNEVVVVGYGTQKKVNLTGAVSTVDVSKTLQARPVSDVSKALQGVAPGLTIINSNGKINDEPSVVIRGIGTLSSGSKAPLIVVDGVPMDDISYLDPNDIQTVSVLKDAASTSIYGTRAAFGVLLITTKSAGKATRTTISYTNNFGWETPTILPNYPDVPTQIKAMISANTRAGAQSELFGMNLNDMLPYAEKWKTQHGNKKAKYREMELYQNDDNVGDFKLDNNGVGMYYADWDVKNIMYRKWKPSENHNISIQGGNSDTSYYLSFGYNHDEGVMKFNPDKLDRYTTVMNVTTNVTKWLQVGGRLNYSDKDYTTPDVRRTSYQYMWRWGSFFGPYGTYKGYDFRNDIAYRKQAAPTKDVDQYTRLGAFLKATILKGLTLNADYTYNIHHFNEHDSFIPVTCWDSWGGDVSENVSTQSTHTGVDMTSARDKSYALNIYGNYAFDLQKDHHFNIMLGGNAEEGDYYSQYSERDDLLDYTKPEFNLATGDQYVSGSHSQWGVAGYFGRINYDYKGIYLLELNGRYDGSSKFPSNDRWAFFPSGSVGYRFSEENFFAPLKKYVSNAKIRASYGQIGNQEVGSNMFIETIGKNSVSWLDDSGVAVVAYGMPSLVSKTLKWERIQTLNLGLDLGFLNNDLNFTGDWFQRTTKDMLAPSKTLPDVLGTSSPEVNAGTLRTRGWEITIDWHHIFTNGLSVYATANVNDYTTKVTKWDNDTKLISSYYSGKNYGDIWGFETDRLFTKKDFNTDGSYASGIASQVPLQSGSFVYGPGDIKFKDLDKSGTIDGGKGTATDHGDLKVIGNTQPRYQYSLRVGAAWKGFDIDMYFQGVGKRDVWTQGAFVMPFMRGVDAIYANETDYWDADLTKYPDGNPNAEFPRLFGGGAGGGKISGLANGRYNFYPQSRYLVNMAYLRFKDLTIGYTLPKELTLKAYIQKVRFYFSGDNLCELIKKSKAPIDPEINDYEGSAANGVWGRIDPICRTMSFGVQVTF